MDFGKIALSKVNELTDVVNLLEIGGGSNITFDTFIAGETVEVLTGGNPVITSGYNTKYVTWTDSINIPYNIADLQGGPFTVTYTLNGVNTVVTNIPEGNNTWNVGLLPNGANQLIIVVTDSEELTSNALLFNITSTEVLVNTAPVLTSDFATVTALTTDSISIPYTITDEEGGYFDVTYVKDGVALTLQDLAPGNNAWNVGQLSAATHTLTITAKDNGNLNSNTLTFTIDVSVPLQTLVYDDFNRPDSNTSLGLANTGQSWVIKQGTVGILNEQAYPVTTDSVVVIESGVSDCVIEAIIASAGTSGVLNNLVARYADSTHYLYFQLSPTNISTYYKNGGGFVQIGSQNLTMTNNDKVSIILKGSSIKIQVNNEQKVSYTNSAHVMTHTKHGLYPYSSTARYDSFTVKA